MPKTSVQLESLCLYLNFLFCCKNKKNRTLFENQFLSWLTITRPLLENFFRSIIEISKVFWHTDLVKNTDFAKILLKQYHRHFFRSPVCGNTWSGKKSECCLCVMLHKLVKWLLNGQKWKSQKGKLHDFLHFWRFCEWIPVIKSKTFVSMFIEPLLLTKTIKKVLSRRSRLTKIWFPFLKQHD